MPKRSFDEKMDYYLRKMEKLKDKHRRKRRRTESYSSADEQNKYYIQGKWCIQNHIIAKKIIKVLFNQKVPFVMIICHRF